MFGLFRKPQASEAAPVGAAGSAKIISRAPVAQARATADTAPASPAPSAKVLTLRPPASVLSAPAESAGPPGRARKILGTADDLANLAVPFEGVLQEVRVSAHLSYSLCPVLLGGAKGTAAAQAAMLVTPAAAQSDEALMVLEQLRTKAGKLWTVPGDPVILCTDTLLLSVVRKAVTKESIAKTRLVQNNPASSGAYNSLREIVRWGLAKGASDITYTLAEGSPKSQVSFIINGLSVSPPEWRMATGTLNGILNTAYMISEGGKEPTYDTAVEQDCRIKIVVEGGEEILLRWSSFAAEYPGPSVTTRVVRQTVVEAQSLEDLGYLPHHCEVIRRSLNAEGGATLLVGAVNSGKTNTIANVMASLPRTRKIMTIENPVELLIPNAIQRNVAGSYTAPLRALKRSAMHDVLLGEIRDVEDGQAFMDLCSMKVNVYSTTHAASVVGAYDKLMQDTVRVSRDFLATPGMIKSIVAQALLPRNCDCAVSFTSLLRDGQPDSRRWKAYGQRVEQLYKLDLEAVRIVNPEGCELCRSSGLPDLYGVRGRVLAAEAYEPDDHCLELIKSRNMIALARYIEEASDGDFASDDMRGKTAMECAVYRMSRGQIDPRHVEPRFHSFEREAYLRASRDRLRERQLPRSTAVVHHPKGA